MAFYPNYPDFTYGTGFYDIRNPKLVDSLFALDKAQREMKQIIGNKYEQRENGIAHIGSFMDDVIKPKDVEDKELKELQDRMLKIKNTDPKVSNLLGSLPKQKMIDLLGSLPKQEIISLLNGSNIQEPIQVPGLFPTNPYDTNNSSNSTNNSSYERSANDNYGTEDQEDVKQSIIFLRNEYYNNNLPAGKLTLKNNQTPFEYKLGNTSLFINHSGELSIIRGQNNTITVEPSDGLLILLISNDPDKITEAYNNGLINKADMRLYKELVKDAYPSRLPVDDPLAQLLNNGILYGVGLHKLIGGKSNKKTKATKIKTKSKTKSKKNGMIYYNNFSELAQKLEILLGEVDAGNNSKELKNQIADIGDILYKNNKLSKSEYNELYSLL